MEAERLVSAPGSPAQAGRAADLLPAVYEALRHLAGGMMARKAPGQTLQATALVPEAFLRLSRTELHRSIIGSQTRNSSSLNCRFNW